MTAPAPESPEPVPDERPRLLINGEPVRPEDLNRALPESVQRRLDVKAAEAPRGTPRRGKRRRASSPSLNPWLLLGGLGLAALAVWRLLQ
ncbi:hypothetical protein [Melittangium boletus]|uniref:Uncharacterized protein n=1 Tax=Melittangium boletus DSM 14713 TaxID=1294270 RepID=A0A250INJ2_9BACT|nr:hypothetical protein [Melittangium boletus]ATB32792.1 hypothetical protein MEBOL_006281 [Melittangium boletus DSM 14713]